MQQTHIRDFTHGNITNQLVSFAWPLFLSNLLQVVYNMVDMIIVGHVLGKAGTSAVAVGGDVSNFLTFIAMGFSSAGQVLIAKYIGGNQKEKLGKFVGTMTGFLTLCAIIISAIALFFQRGILALMNTPEEALSGAVSYSSVCMAGLVFIYGYNIVSAIMRGMGDSKRPFIFIGIAAILNVVLDILFVIVLRMDAGGAALATVISQGISFFCCGIFLLKNKEKYALVIDTKNFLFWDKEMLGSLLKLGTPMAIKSASVHVSKLFVNSWINSYGVEISAFAGIANKLSSISILFSNAMNAAGSTMVGQNIAACKYDRVRKILLRLAVITLTIATLLSLTVILFPQQVFRIFTDDPSVLSLVRGYIPIAILLFFGSALRAIMNALINGSGHYAINFATAILDGIVMRIGLAVLFGLMLNLRHYGFWLGDALAGLTPFWVGIIFYFTGQWKKTT